MEHVATHPPPVAARVEIVRSIQQLVSPGALFEVRIPKMRQAGRNVPMSGYFDDAEQAADEIMRLDRLKPEGIYVTLHEPDPACRPRGFGLIQAASATTSDADIQLLRWIPVDVDAVRPSGTSATEAQLSAAAELADRVVALLDGYGFPAPYRADSGNGRHVLYPCEFAPTATPLVKRFLAVLGSMFDTSAAKVDRGVFNPSRIWKICGTVARKGEHTAEQPHRLACITQTCDRAALVTEAQVEAFLAAHEVKPKPGRPRRTAASAPIDVPSFCREYNLEIRREDSWNGGTRFILEHCAFDENHNGTSAAILQLASGATAYKCLHDSCQTHDWAALRRRVGAPAKLPPARRSTSDGSAQTHELADDTRTKIELSNNIAEIVDEVVRVVCTPDAEFYSRGGILVRVREAEYDNRIQRDQCAPMIVPLPNASLCELVTRECNFGAWRTKEVDDPNEPSAPATKDSVWVPAPAPKRVIDALEHRGTWPGLRELAGISEGPILRPDGSIFQTKGYDEQTGILYLPTDTFPPIPDGPIAKDVAVAAAQQIFDIVQDFPFEDGVAGAHRAAWLAALITLACRSAIHGSVPCFIFDANSQGAGKTLLASLTGTIAYGRPIPEAGYSSEDEEQRKCITSAVLAGDRALMLDNLTGAFGGSAIDRAITSTFWKDRRLGKNENIELPMRIVFCVTGNNVAIKGDAARRVVPIRLTTPEENPETRDSFAYPDIRNHVRENRPQFLTAVLTILAAYIRAGLPTFNLGSFGSFEAWSDLVRNAVYWVTEVDALATRDGLAVADDGTDLHSHLLTAWYAYKQDATTLNALILELDAEARRTVSDNDTMPAPRDLQALALRVALEAVVNVPRGGPLRPAQVSQRVKGYRDKRGTILVNGKPTLAYLHGQKAGNVTEWRVCTDAATPF